mmetsp:Transcript_17553/g.35863  ORF Transcript_17553/g.35863 Transcript_17553/m.35863 type:complete len:96 (+) Transcript_17553:2139-2426(+)
MLVEKIEMICKNSFVTSKLSKNSVFGLVKGSYVLRSSLSQQATKFHRNFPCHVTRLLTQFQNNVAEKTSCFLLCKHQNHNNIISTHHSSLLLFAI